MYDMRRPLGRDNYGIGQNHIRPYNALQASLNKLGSVKLKKENTVIPEKQYLTNAH
jgi:hypothetical protein